MSSLTSKREDSVNPAGFESRFINRELSWLKFNERVLEVAVSKTTPLLERLRFLSIFESNLDEFYMVRVSGFVERLESGIADRTPDGKSAAEQLRLIYEAALPLRRRAGLVFENELRKDLEQAGVVIRRFSDLSSRSQSELESYFRREVFPLCTPLSLSPTASFPFISNRSLNLAVLLEDEDGIRVARVKVPPIVPRLVRIGRKRHEYVLLEDLIASHLSTLFPGIPVIGGYRFRVIRDADFEIRELEAADLISMVEQTLRMRRFGAPVLLEAEESMPEQVRTILMQGLELDDTDVFIVDGILGFEVFEELAQLPLPELKFPHFQPYLADRLATSKHVLDSAARTETLVHHPFDSFMSVENFVASAARDPAVIGIKQTLYRTGSESPIVESLLAAAEAGKQVAVMVELKARFDESNNLEWSRRLERAGVHVTYGIPEMKTHCKLCLVVRRTSHGVRQCAHVGTGNYNPQTARLYTDLGLFTSDPEIIQDVAELFNILTGFSRQTKFRKMLVAPQNLRDGILDRIEREVKSHEAKGNGRIIIKANALVDPEVITALYAASGAGVQIDLIVRGICCLRPGVKGLSENIRVRSIVGRFLEHSRVYFFQNGDHPEALIGSADMMTRNFDRRIETLVPIGNAKNLKYVHDVLLQTYLRDSANASELRPDGTYERVIPKNGMEPFCAQEYFMQHPTTKALYG